MGREPDGNSGKKYLLVDDASIENSDGLERIFHAATVDPDQPVLKGTYPWEQYLGAWIYGSVHREPGTQLYEMWYQAFSIPEGGLVCYATSGDGLFWERPLLGLISWRGDTRNNIVWAPGLPDSNCPSVVVSPVCEVEDRRYKLYAWQGHHHLAYSRDGKSFTRGEPIDIAGGSDVFPTIYDEQSERYVSFVKPHGTPRRLVGRSVSADGRAWSVPRVVLRPDNLDDELARAAGADFAELYGMSGFPYEGMYFGFLWVLYGHSRPAPSGTTLGAMHVELAYSYDGERWLRPTRMPVIPIGPAGSYRHHVGATATRPVVTSDELRVYFSGSTAGHGVLPPEAVRSIGLARFRRDGFVSLRSGFAGGRLITKPFPLEGETIELNVSARDGSVTGEVADESGSPFQGFSAADSEPIVGDGCNIPLSWGGSSSLASLRGRLVRLRLDLRAAEVYGFTVR